MGNGEWGMGNGEWGMGRRTYFPLPTPHSPLPTPHSPHFALVGYSRSNTNSVMNSVRATTEVFAAQ
jgi:hypothetical protein